MFMSLPSREAWIEIWTGRKGKSQKARSLPSREAWIEIPEEVGVHQSQQVASLAGSVD